MARSPSETCSVTKWRKMRLNPNELRRVAMGAIFGKRDPHGETKERLLHPRTAAFADSFFSEKVYLDSQPAVRLPLQVLRGFCKTIKPAKQGTLVLASGFGGHTSIFLYSLSRLE